MKEEEVLSSLLKRIGRKLTELRKQKGYTSHEDFAFDHEIPRVLYWRIEKGKTNPGYGNGVFAGLYRHFYPATIVAALRSNAG